MKTHPSNIRPGDIDLYFTASLNRRLARHRLAQSIWDAAIPALLLLGAMAFSCSALAATDDEIANAIYKLEGGAKAKAPYGILSIKVRDAAHGRKICLNTIRNSRTRWIKSGRPGDELDFLANRYCPPSADPVGNRNWKRNIHKLTK